MHTAHLSFTKNGSTHRQTFQCFYLYIFQTYQKHYVDSSQSFLNTDVFMMLQLIIMNFHFHNSDLCSAFGAKMMPMVDRESITNLLTQGRRSKMQKAKTLATWATKEIRRLKNAASSW